MAELRAKKIKFVIAIVLAFCMTINLLPAGLLALAEESISKETYTSAIARIVDAAKERKAEASLSGLNVPASYGRELYFDALSENPEIFYMSRLFTDSNVKTDGSGNITAITMSYYGNEYDLRGKGLVLEKAAREFTSSYPFENMNVAEKYLAIFEYIIENVKKNTGSAIVSAFGSSAYGALVEGSADSLGYALAYKYLAEKIGLNAIIIYGVNNSDACWNAIEIDGSYFYVDAFEADKEYSTLLSGTTSRISTVDHFMFMSDKSSFELLGHVSGTNYGYGDPVAVKGSGALKYKRFWTGVTSQMVYAGGNWYCISGIKTQILKRNPNADVPVNEPAYYSNQDGLMLGLITGDNTGKIYFTILDAEVVYIDTTSAEETPTANLLYNAYGSNLKINSAVFNGNAIKYVFTNSDGVASSEKYYYNGAEVSSAKKISLGDINGDGAINAADLTLISEYIKNDTALPTDRETYADIDCNGVIDVFDRAYIARLLAGESYINTTYFS